MSITIKSLIFILLIGSFLFWFVSLLKLETISKKELLNWRNVWLANQALAFLSPSIWVYYAVFIVVSFLWLPKKPESKVLIYILLLGSLPMMQVNLLGFGVINYLFSLNYARALALVILLPAFFALAQGAGKQLRLFSQPADKFVVLFIVVISLLDFRDDTALNGVRFLFLHFVDLFLPYYVISRSITNVENLNKCLTVLLISTGLLACFAVFETVKNWHIYNHLVQHLISAEKVTTSEVRGGMLRAAVTFMTPIMLGFILTVGFGVYLYLSAFVKNKSLRKLPFIALVTGLVCTVSRGPWVGLAFLLLVFIWTGRQKIAQYSKLIAGLIITLPILLITPFGQNFIDILPFVGTIRAETVDYRARLFDMASIVVQRNPWFGSTTYIDTPEMQTMIQGEGIVDVVNSYLQVVLQYGWVGLILFIAIFISLLKNIFMLNKRLYKEDEQLFHLGRALFSVLSATALIIYTVSSVDYIPYYYWLLFGLSSSFIYVSKASIDRRNA
jgi:O-antigen ligase